MQNEFDILTVNPGSTSTKIALFSSETAIFTQNIQHTNAQLSAYPRIVDQLDFRKQAILNVLEEHQVDLQTINAFSGRCTGLLPMAGGVYEINDLMYEHGKIGIGSKHPGNLGPMICKDFSDQYGGKGFVVNPSSVDEFTALARVTGFSEILRTSRGHPLNQKAVANKFAQEIGKPYDGINVIVAHLGGGISITSHKKGRMVDTIDSTRGEGRMAPTRTGGLPAASVVELCFSNKYHKEELLDKIMKTGGWIDWLGTSDALEIERRIQCGDGLAEFIYNATAYQIAKDIGACAAVLSGEVDSIILTGGLAFSKNFVGMITKRVEFIAPVVVYPGEYEMEALALGALRVLTGEETAKYYTGEPVFKGFDAGTFERDY